MGAWGPRGVHAAAGEAWPRRRGLGRSSGVGGGRAAPRGSSPPDTASLPSAWEEKFISRRRRRGGCRVLGVSEVSEVRGRPVRAGARGARSRGKGPVRKRSPRAGALPRVGARLRARTAMGSRGNGRRASAALGAQPPLRRCRLPAAPCPGNRRSCVFPGNWSGSGGRGWSSGISLSDGEVGQGAGTGTVSAGSQTKTRKKESKTHPNHPNQKCKMKANIRFRVLASAGRRGGHRTGGMQSSTRGPRLSPPCLARTPTRWEWASCPLDSACLPTAFRAELSPHGKR